MVFQMYVHLVSLVYIHITGYSSFTLSIQILRSVDYKKNHHIFFLTTVMSLTPEIREDIHRRAASKAFSVYTRFVRQAYDVLPEGHTLIWRIVSDAEESEVFNDNNIRWIKDDRRRTRIMSNMTLQGIYTDNVVEYGPVVARQYLQEQVSVLKNALQCEGLTCELTGEGEMVRISFSELDSA